MSAIVDNLLGFFRSSDSPSNILGESHNSLSSSESNGLDIGFFSRVEDTEFFKKGKIITAEIISLRETFDVHHAKPKTHDKGVVLCQIIIYFLDKDEMRHSCNGFTINNRENEAYPDLMEVAHKYDTFVKVGVFHCKGRNHSKYGKNFKGIGKYLFHLVSAKYALDRFPMFLEADNRDTNDSDSKLLHYYKTLGFESGPCPQQEDNYSTAIMYKLPLADITAHESLNS
jgi:hypothetical protein